MRACTHSQRAAAARPRMRTPPDAFAVAPCPWHLRHSNTAAQRGGRLGAAAASFRRPISLGIPTGQLALRDFLPQPQAFQPGQRIGELRGPLAMVQIDETLLRGRAEHNDRCLAVRARVCACVAVSTRARWRAHCARRQRKTRRAVHTKMCSHVLPAEPRGNIAAPAEHRGHQPRAHAPVPRASNPVPSAQPHR